MMVVEVGLSKILVLVLAACSIEQGFGKVDPATTESPPGRAPSEWDQLDAGSLPDVAFVAVWDDVTGIEALDEPNDQYPCRPGPSLWTAVHGQPRVDLLDLQGQVLGNLVFPHPFDPYDDPTLQAIGSTEALLVEGGYPTRHAWNLDLVGLEVTPLATWDLSSPGAALEVAGAPHPLPVAVADLHPTRIGDQFYVAAELVGSTVPPPLDTPVLFEFDLASPTAEPTSWAIGDLLPPEFATLDPLPYLYIRRLHPANGELVLQLTFYGPAWDGSDGTYDWRYLRFVFLPDTGARSWTIELGEPTIESWTEPVHRHTSEARAALFTEYAYQNPEPALILYDTTRSPTTIVPPDSTCLSGQILFDAAAPTVAYTRHDPAQGDDYGNSVVVHHDGAEVWRIDTLSLGLDPRRAHVRSIVALE